MKYIVNSMLKADEKKMLQSNAEMETVISLLLFCHTALEKQVCVIRPLKFFYIFAFVGAIPNHDSGQAI